MGRGLMHKKALQRMKEYPSISLFYYLVDQVAPIYNEGKFLYKAFEGGESLFEKHYIL